MTSIQTSKDFIEAYRLGVEPVESEEIFEVVQMMEKMGGSFVKAIAHCWHMADPINKRKMAGCFNEYFSEYAMQVERGKK